MKLKEGKEKKKRDGGIALRKKCTQIKQKRVILFSKRRKKEGKMTKKKSRNRNKDKTTAHRSRFAAGEVVGWDRAV
jgi:hypothetical protein